MTQALKIRPIQFRWQRSKNVIRPGQGLLPLPGTYTLRGLGQVIVCHQQLVLVNSSLTVRQQQQQQQQKSVLEPLQGQRQRENVLQLL